MSDRNVNVTAPRHSVPEQPSRAEPPADYWPEQSRWVGWVAFAGMMMMLLGSLHAIEGLVAIFQDHYFLVGQNQLVVHVDYTVWGWVHLVAGILVACAGGALLSGRMWARVIAVILAFGSALLNIGFLSAYPIWSTIMIAIDVLVIWAVMVHGRELRSGPGSGY
jgi:hypothetical protein